MDLIKFSTGFPLEGPTLALAPMEGVLDAPMRAYLTELGGYSYCVSEFIRVSGSVPPPKVFYRHVPELHSRGRTASGVPVQVQLLGGDPEKLAESAAVACGLGAPAIDLNFGCPAPTVNRHDGGAVLLKTPRRIRDVVAAVRAAVPPGIAVSAKLRLGWDDPRAIHQNVDAAVEGGAAWITIHARTKMQGYAPPADWEKIAEVRRRLDIPVIANGDIWSEADYSRCRQVTGCRHFMLGRGALAHPRLQLELGGVKTVRSPEAFAEWLPDLRRFAEVCELTHPERDSSYTLRRIKQWMRMVQSRDPAFAGFQAVRHAQSLGDIPGF